MATDKAQSTVSATCARVHFGEIIKRAHVGREPVVVEKDGIPVVVVLSFPMYQQLLREAKLSRFGRLSQVAGMEAEQQGLTEERLAVEMEAIRERSHRELYG